MHCPQKKEANIIIRPILTLNFPGGWGGQFLMMERGQMSLRKVDHPLVSGSSRARRRTQKLIDG